MTRVSTLLLASALAACAAPAASLMDGRSADDAVRLLNGDVLRGRIVEDDGRQIVLERDDRFVTVPRATVHSVEYSKDSYRERTQPLRLAEAPSEAVRPASTWMPRAHPGERVEPHEVLWFDGHAASECLGRELLKAHEDLPDLTLFTEPGGRLVLQDPKKWGYHAHVQPWGFHRPGVVPGLVLSMPDADAALPTAVTFVSPSQEVKSAEVAERGSYALPDAVHAVVRPLGEADAILAAQPFSGGRPAATRHGTLWAFAMPRNARQFLVVALDAQRKHGEVLQASFVAYGDTILAPDLLIDSVAADGTVLGRAFVVPFPDGVAADGPAPQAVAVYAGPVKDPALVVTLPLAPRHSIQIPPRAAATKAAVLVSAFEVSKSVPQSLVLAWGIGRPTRDVTLSVRELTPADADPVIKIDLTSLPEERFPAVAWIYERRSYVWRSTGGRLPAVEPLARGA
ncbi:MAG TPA: hypothetical protein VEJ18_08945, partial [Planctomycetota bacterium]|nr:hypothetical protein [Planctomycetota bacterium]